MNVLFILADQHNASFTGCYGGITRTPNLDRLAEEGAIFESAYTPCPMCAPARASLYTGMYVHENKCWDNCFPYNGEIDQDGDIILENVEFISRPLEN